MPAPEIPTPEKPLDISLKLDDFGDLTEREQKLKAAVMYQAASQAWIACNQAWIAANDDLAPLRQRLRELVEAHPSGWKS